MACGGKLLIKFVIEQHDLAGNFVAAERGKFVKVVHHNYLGGDSRCRRSYAAAHSREHHFLRFREPCRGIPPALRSLLRAPSAGRQLFPVLH